ncbi:aromatic ring-opening dioxygenase family protein [Aspergillus japonicus CBS 114.51]|uniref:Aromatic ring-opening dioxygenase family protein n=1 Tax=Aspergillus japonicus CBS 114.51 TaxID=1448312 RepID=A0A8T8X7Z4_ASPJA|nr:aromatic ring-opening dioxygenase family protein [Aspergillus japonicus CBS 114.51]RAH84246.1 aromatic ring-opening dioxygenase family protein [Aspergillus japonicus CBS 114.51]
MPLTPVHFFSHGSTAMLGEESDSADYWQRCGQAALDNGIEHVVIMGAHWVTTGDSIQIATNPTPAKNPIGGVHPSKYVPYHLNPDLPMCNRVQQLLQSAGFNATPNPTVDWIHDIYLILIRTFPKQCPPTTVLSLNARFDPHYHLRVGAALRPLRHEKVLFIGSGGTVHNLYRNTWGPLLRYADNFAMEAPPGDWALAFRQEMEDAVTKAARKGSGVGLRKAVTGLLKVPRYREAHATDDHIMSLMFVAGLVGDVEDTGDAGSEGVEIGAEDWELTNMCNTQFTFGRW